jgi:hypothetical protein
MPPKKREDPPVPEYDPTESAEMVIGSIPVPSKMPRFPGLMVSV